MNPELVKISHRIIAIGLILFPIRRYTTQMSSIELALWILIMGSAAVIYFINAYQKSGKKVEETQEHEIKENIPPYENQKKKTVSFFQTQKMEKLFWFCLLCFFGSRLFTQELAAPLYWMVVLFGLFQFIVLIIASIKNKSDEKSNTKTETILFLIVWLCFIYQLFDFDYHTLANLIALIGTLIRIFIYVTFLFKRTTS